MCNKHIVRLLLLFIVVALVGAMLVPTAYAATTVTPVTGLTVTDSTGNGKLSSGTVTITANGDKGMRDQRVTNTITIKNESGAAAQVSFGYSATNYDTFQMNEASASATGSVNQLMENGATITFTLKGKHGGWFGSNPGDAVLTLSDFALVEAKESSNIVFNYDKTKGNITVDGASVATGNSVDIPSTGSSLVATPASGATFVAWVDASTRRIINKSASFTYQPASDVTVIAVFGSASTDAWFEVDGVYLTDNLTTASSLGTKIVLAADGTLPAGDYTIPANKTLLIPFDSAGTLYTTDPGRVTFDASTGGAFTPVSIYRTLNMAEGANIIVNGAISISGKQCSTQDAGYNGAPTGPQGRVNMATGSSITVNSGGKLYVWGFITGSGSVLARSGAEVYEDFQIRDWRGGTATSSMLGNDQKVFPLSQYYIQNIEVPLTLEVGAKEVVSSSVDITAVGIQTPLVTLIGKDDGMFRLTSGTLTKDYDEKNDRLIFTVEGDISISTLLIELKLSLFGTKSINSKDYVLPLNSNYTVNVDSGTLTISQDVALLPGAQINIAKGASAVLGNGANIYVYDSADWGGYTGTGNNTFKTVVYSSSCSLSKPIRTSLSDAVIHVEGTLDASAGVLYTTTSGVSISGVTGGTVKIKQGGATVTYQGTQGGSDGKQMTYVDIPIISARLKNGNGTYQGAVANATTFVYNSDGVWRCAEGTHTDESADGICDVCKWVMCTHATMNDATYTGDGINEYIATRKCANCDYKEEAKATITSKVNVAATCASAGQRIYTATFDVDWAENKVTEQAIAKLAHTWDDGVVTTAPTCTVDGVKTFTCSACGETKTESIANTGHKEVVDPAVAADCLNSGLTEGKHCSVCNEVILAQQTITALGHNTVTDAAAAPTCTATGLTEGSHCDRCGEVFVAQEVIPATGHSFSESWSNDEAKHWHDCTECGADSDAAGHTDENQNHYCDVCDYKVTECADAQPKDHVCDYDGCKAAMGTHADADGDKDHNCDYCGGQMGSCTAGEVKNENVKAPTCTADGSHDEVTYCTECGKELSRKTVTDAQLSHTPAVDAAVAPTCTTTGLTEGSHCSVCNTVLVAQTVLDALGHTEGAVKVENNVAPDCDSTGSYDNVVYCSVCDAELSRNAVTVDALGHKPGETVVENNVAPTCTAEGHYDNVVYCTACKAELSRNTVTVEKAAHTAGEVVVENNVAPTCTADGSYDNVVYCSVCKAELSRQNVVVPATGHTAGEVVVENEKAADCVNTGSYDNVTYCTVCGEETSRKTITVDALGHKYESVVTEPTCTEGGYTTKTCTTCGDKVIFAPTAAKGHSYDNGVVTTAPTCTEDGVKTFTCHCGHSYTEGIKATGHTAGAVVVENKVDATCSAEGHYDNVVYCSVCGAELSRKTVTVEALGHDEINHDAKAPTCTEIGWDAYVTCSRCDYTTHVEKAALGHTWTPATYEAPMTCSVCGATQGEPLAKPVEVVKPEDVTVEPNEGIDLEDIKEAVDAIMDAIMNAANQIEKPDTGIETDENREILDAAKENLSDEAVEYETSLVITLNTVVVDKEGEEILTNKVSYDVTPWMYARNEKGEVVDQTKLNGFEAEITFRLPFTGSANAKYARVWHEGVELKLHEIHTDEHGNRYVEVKSKNFSVFTVGDHEHTWDEGTVTVEPTTTTVGEMTYTCTHEDCNESYTEEIPMLEITYTVRNYTGNENAYTIDGTTLNVRNDIACAVLVAHRNSTYTRLTANAKGDGSYNFDISGVADGEQIIIAVKGDIDLDGTLEGLEVIQIGAAQLGKLKTFNALQIAVADLDGDGAIEGLEVIQIGAAQLNKLILKW